MVSCTRRANRPPKSWIPEEQIEWILAAWDLARVMTVRGGFRAGGRGRLEGLDQTGRSLAVAGSPGCQWMEVSHWQRGPRAQANDAQKAPPRTENDRGEDRLAPPA